MWGIDRIEKDLAMENILSKIKVEEEEQKSSKKKKKKE